MRSSECELRMEVFADRAGAFDGSTGKFLCLSMNVSTRNVEWGVTVKTGCLFAQVCNEHENQWCDGVFICKRHERYIQGHTDVHGK